MLSEDQGGLAYFAEYKYPCEVNCGEYQRLMLQGLDRMGKSSVIICGLARSIAGILPRTIARIERLGSMFREYRVIVVENDSCDSTATDLNIWASKNSRVNIISFKENLKHHPQNRSCERTLRLASLRNIYLNACSQLHSEFVIILDTDLEIGWSYEGIANTFGHSNWDVVGSNSITFRSRRTVGGDVIREPYYYDTWAFRKKRNYSFMLLEEEMLDVLPPRGSPLIPCHSCFGGLAIYSSQSLLKARYAGGDCEHVRLHEDLRSDGFNRIYLNPSQITVYDEKNPRISCISIIEELNENLKFAVDDFINQTYMDRELILVANVSNNLSTKHLSDNAFPYLNPVTLPEWAYDTACDHGIKAANGSITCEWNLSLRHHPSHLEEQLRAFHLRRGEACYLCGMFIYLYERNEVYCWCQAKEVIGNFDTDSMSYSSPMAYRHVASRLLTPSLRKNGRLQGRRKMGGADLEGRPRIVIPPLGGVWLTMQRVATADRNKLDHAFKNALSKAFILENKSDFNKVLRVYGLEPGTKVLGSDGFAFNIH